MPKLTVNGKEIEVPAGTNLIEAARAAGVEVPHYCYHPGLVHRRPVPALHGGHRQGAAAADRLQHRGRRGDGGGDGDPAGQGHAAVDDGVPPHQPSPGLPGVRPGGGVLAPDLLHEARALRPAHDRREGPQAQGGAPRAPRHPGRRALHPLLALRALLRRDHRHRRVGHLPTWRPLRDRALPGHRAGERVLGQRHRHLPGGRAHRPRLPLPGAGVVPRHRQERLQRLRARVQHRDPHQPSNAPTTTRASAWPASSPASMPRSTSGGSATPAATASAGSTTRAASPRPRVATDGAAGGDHLGRRPSAPSPTRSAVTGPRRSASSPRPRCPTRISGRSGASSTVWASSTATSRCRRASPARTTSS